MRLHLGIGVREARERTLQLLDRVGIADAAQRLDAYPHQFSGGQRQRITIAMALACNPDLLIADEPTTALDVTIQRQILDLMRELVAERGMALILISHDLGVIARNVQRMMVMYGGAVVEQGSTASVFGAHAHPYTRGLFGARPRLAHRAARGSSPSRAACRSSPTCPRAAPSPAAAHTPCRPAIRRCRSGSRSMRHIRCDATGWMRYATEPHGERRCARPFADARTRAG